MEDKIIEILRSSNGLSFYESDFYDKLNLNDKEDYEKLAKSLVNLTENGILYRSNKNIIENMGRNCYEIVKVENSSERVADIYKNKIFTEENK